MTRRPAVHWNDKWEDAWIDGSELKRPPSPAAIIFFRTTAPSPFTAPKSPPAISDHDFEYIQPDDFSPKQNDLPFTVVRYPSSSSSSLETYTSSQSSETDSTAALDDYSDKIQHLHPCESGIPSSLPISRRGSVTDPTIRSSDPRAFSKLFPSMDLLSIRHDDRSVDGNLNLRVETTATTMKKRPVTVQLFHLVMYDLVQRDFSLLRYGPDSGREVCSSRRSASVSRPGPAMQQIYSALQSPFLRSRANSYPSHEPDQARIGPPHHAQPVSNTRSTQYEDTRRVSIPSPNTTITTHEREKPSNTIKLEFSNYASITLHHKHKSSKKYTFDWWGHNYTWRRETNKSLNAASFHLIRDGDSAAPVAHIVPEVQSPTEAQAERAAGGWVPPCFMWICDTSVIEALTDVAEYVSFPSLLFVLIFREEFADFFSKKISVIVATGLITLVDDSIRRRWQVEKIHSRRISAVSAHTDTRMNKPGPARLFMSRMFPRRHSMQQPNSPVV